MDADPRPSTGHGEAVRFALAWWVVALFVLGAFGGAALLIFGATDLAQEADDPVDILWVVFVVVALGGLVVLPSFYYLVRATRGIPMIMIDSRGAVLGGSWEEDLAVEWSNVRRIRVRRHSQNGITDTQLLFDLADDRPLMARARGFRRRATVQLNRLMFGAPFGLSTVWVRGGSSAVMLAIGRHYRGSVVPA